MVIFNPETAPLAKKEGPRPDGPRADSATGGPISPGGFHERRLDREFWTEWVRGYDRLFARALQRSGGRLADAEDSMSVAALRGVRMFRRHSWKIRSVEGWLATLLTRVCSDQRRARSRGTFVTREVDDSIDLAAPPPVELCAREEFEGILREIARLPDGLRNAFELRVLRGHTYASVASRLGVTSSAARKRVQLARFRLRDSLKRPSFDQSGLSSESRSHR